MNTTNTCNNVHFYNKNLQIGTAMSVPMDGRAPVAGRDGFTLSPEIKASEVAELRAELQLTKKNQAFIGKFWDGFKNLTGLGLGSNKVQKAIDRYEKGEITLEEAQTKIDEYKDGQSTAVDVAADLVSGIVAFGAFALAVPTGGASLVLGLGVATAVGAGLKIGIKSADACATGKGYSGKDLLYDSVTGAFNGVLAPITNGIGNTVIKTIGQKLGLKFVQKSAEHVVTTAAKQGVLQSFKDIVMNQTIDAVGGTLSKRILAFGAGMAVDGTIGGAADNMVRAGLNGENVIKAGLQGAVAGAVMAPVIGGGLRVAGKAGHAISKDIQTAKVAKRAAQRVTNDPELQSALAQLVRNEGIVIRTREDAFPILQAQYQDIISRSPEIKDNLIVLDINPQLNNGMPKSNNLISRWFVDANGLSEDQLITLTTREIKDGAKLMQINDICCNWQVAKDMEAVLEKQKNLCKKAMRKTGADVPRISLQQARKVVEDTRASIEFLTNISDYTFAELESIARKRSDTRLARIVAALKNDFTDADLKELATIMEKLRPLDELVESRRLKQQEALIEFREISEKLRKCKERYQATGDESLQETIKKLETKWETADLAVKAARRQYRDKAVQIQIEELRAQYCDTPIVKSIRKKISKEYLEDELLTKAMMRIDSVIRAKTKDRVSYVDLLARQVQQAIRKSNGKPLTIVIPDDCSLSGSSMICDTVRILNSILKNTDTIEPKVNIVFAPMILGQKAQDAIERFRNFNFSPDEFETFLSDVSAVKNVVTPSGTTFVKDSFECARHAFRRVAENLEHFDISIAGGYKQAVHYTETPTYQGFSDDLKTLLPMLMSGKNIDGNGALFGGYHDCGVLVVNPTEEFILDGVTYAGKIPTNSVGFMELVGLEAGVLNDTTGVFNKGTGGNYRRFCEWENLESPITERRKIYIDKDFKVRIYPDP